MVKIPAISWSGRLHYLKVQLSNVFSQTESLLVNSPPWECGVQYEGLTWHRRQHSWPQRKAWVFCCTKRHLWKISQKPSTQFFRLLSLWRKTNLLVLSPKWAAQVYVRLPLLNSVFFAISGINCNCTMKTIDSIYKWVKKEAVNIQAIMLSSLLVSWNCFSQTSLCHSWYTCQCCSTFGLSPAYSRVIYYVGTNYLWICLPDNKCKVKTMLEPENSMNIASKTWQGCPSLQRPLKHNKPRASDR